MLNALTTASREMTDAIGKTRGVLQIAKKLKLLAFRDTKPKPRLR